MKIEAVGKIWDKIKDTVTTTTTKSNEHAQTYNVEIKHVADYVDALYMNASTRYIWRYPVYHLPGWAFGKTQDSNGDFNSSKVKSQQTYISFAISEPSIPSTAKGTGDSHYQPYHEEGNLFSYPVDLEQVEGYLGSKKLYSESRPMEWGGTNYDETITFIDTTTNQEETKKVNSRGPVTKFLSFVDNIFGSSFANVPWDSTASFMRKVSNTEGIHVKIPTADDGATFYARFEPYLDTAGAANVSWAVTGFKNEDAMWTDDSVYRKYPDPSLLLPEKFDYKVSKKSTEWDRGEFVTNTNDATALKMRGVRFIASECSMSSDNFLLDGVNYTIKVPVFSASFKTATNFSVRLSYSEVKKDQIAPKYDAPRTTINTYTFSELPGWGKGDHRQYATFHWKPDLNKGKYFLFVDIAPEGALVAQNEIHRNRCNASGDIVDSGGNNMGYCVIGVTTVDSPVYDRSNLDDDDEAVSRTGTLNTNGGGEEQETPAVYFLPSGVNASANDASVFPFIEFVSADGMDFPTFIKKEVDGKDRPITAELEVKYAGEHVMTDAVLIGYSLKPESKGKSVSEVTDEDIGYVFVKEHFFMLPEGDHRLFFKIDPNYLEDGVGFALQVYGHEYPITDVVYGSAGSDDAHGVGSSSSGGCESGLGVMAGVAALGLALMKRR